MCSVAATVKIFLISIINWQKYIFRETVYMTATIVANVQEYWVRQKLHFLPSSSQGNHMKFGQVILKRWRESQCGDYGHELTTRIGFRYQQCRQENWYKIKCLKTCLSSLQSVTETPKTASFITKLSDVS